MLCLIYYNCSCISLSPIKQNSLEKSPPPTSPQASASSSEKSPPSTDEHKKTNGGGGEGGQQQDSNTAADGNTDSKQVRERGCLKERREFVYRAQFDVFFFFFSLGVLRQRKRMELVMKPQKKRGRNMR